MSRLIDEVGKKYSRLLVLRHTNEGFWECICDCGKTILVKGVKLRKGHTQSCGCLQREAIKNIATTHGKSDTVEYSSWLAMKQRCLNPNNTNYKNYGGRGIKVCDEWLESFENFLQDMGNRPEGTSLERKDVNGDYSKLNCEWASFSKQSYNRNTKSKKGRSCGVYYRKDRNSWLAVIHKDNKWIRLGSFRAEEDAVAARRQGEEVYWNGVQSGEK